MSIKNTVKSFAERYKKYRHKNLFYVFKWYENWVKKKRKQFLTAKNPEALNKRIMKFYAPFVPLVFFVGPEGSTKDYDVIERKKFLLEHTKPKAIDVGMYDGYFVRELRKNGIETVGVDNVNLLVRHAKKKDPGGEYYKGYSEKLSFPDNIFETAIYSHILEHVLSVDEVLKEARRILRPGGKIIVIVPLDIGFDPNHLREFRTEGELTSVISKFFKIESYHDRVGRGHGCIAVKM